MNTSTVIGYYGILIVIINSVFSIDNTFNGLRIAMKWLA